MPRTRLGAIVALLSVALLAGACASARPDAGATSAPGTLAITAPANGTTVDTPTIIVTGTAPDDAEVVHDIAFAPDDRVTAAGGRWLMTVELDEGANELTFRIGDDEDTARTITVTYRPAAAATATPEATEAPTTEPAEPATPEPTTEATEEPTEPPLAEAFKPITLKGRGNKVAKFKIPEDAAAIATITNKGTSNFAVWTVAADGSTNDLLVNEIGSYKGTHLFDASSDEHSVAFKIESNGSWTIAVKPVTRARAWDGTGRLDGKGADVIRLTEATSGLTVATITHKGSSNFAVISYGIDGRDLLVNEIGRYNGESLVAEGTMLFTIEADGAWTMKLE